MFHQIAELVRKLSLPAQIRPVSVPTYCHRFPLPLSPFPFILFTFCELDRLLVSSLTVERLEWVNEPADTSQPIST